MENKIENPQIDLILCTKGRTEDLARFCSALETQNYTPLRLIVVDQNGDDRILPIVERFKAALQITYLTSVPGLSLGRNIALSKVSGDIIGFPDDDCVYPPNFLRRLVEDFRARDEAIISVRSAGLSGGPAGPIKMEASAPITKENIWRAIISYTFFVRASALDHIKSFDEKLGVGSATPLKSGEETDFALRILADGKSGWYDNNLEVFHPENVISWRMAKKKLGYGAGTGFVYARHGFPLSRTLRMLIGPAVRSVKSMIALDGNRLICEMCELCGRLQGLAWHLFAKNNS